MHIARRGFLKAAAGTCLLGGCKTRGAFAGTAREKVPYRVLFSNDITNILSCPSPFKKRGEPFRETDLRASVAETAGQGIDAHLLQPGLCWVPWWRSEVLPMARHAAWLNARGQKAGSFETYVLNGGDPVRVFIDACRTCGEAPFVSFRVNDAHHIFRGSKAKPADREKAMTEFQFFADHPEWRLGPDLGPVMRYQFDWAQPGVRAYKLALIEELCDRYDFDGLELDFMRHVIYFSPKRTTAEQRRAIQTGFVRDVRRILDRRRVQGKRRWLCVRIPSDLSQHDGMGIDLPSFAAAGVDMVNASGYYFTDGQMPIAAMRRALPERVALYAEIHFAVATTQRVPSPDGKSFFSAHRRTTPEEIYTVAHQTYEQGGNGVSAFNFQYYRGTYNPSDVYGKSAKPPYGVFAHLGDRAWVARQPQHYVVGTGRWGGGLVAKLGVTVTQTLFMSPPTQGWKKAGRLRIQSAQSLGDSRWAAAVNGVALESVGDVSEPYPNPYAVGLGEADDFRAWTVPVSALRKGDNAIAVTLKAGAESKITFMDLALG